MLSLEKRMIAIHLHIYRNGVPITQPLVPALFNTLAGLSPIQLSAPKPRAISNNVRSACTLTERCDCHTNPIISSYSAHLPSAYSLYRESGAATRHLYASISMKGCCRGSGGRGNGWLGRGSSSLQSKRVRYQL